MKYYKFRCEGQKANTKKKEKRNINQKMKIKVGKLVKKVYKTIISNNRKIGDLSF